MSCPCEICSAIPLIVGHIHACAAGASDVGKSATLPTDVRTEAQESSLKRSSILHRSCWEPCSCKLPWERWGCTEQQPTSITTPTWPKESGGDIRRSVFFIHDMFVYTFPIYTDYVESVLCLIPPCAALVPRLPMRAWHFPIGVPRVVDPSFGGARPRGNPNRRAYG